MLSAELAERRVHKVVYAPLHRLDASKSLEEAIRTFVSAPNHPLNGVDPFEETPLLLILDGLDELSKQGRVGADVARNFVDEIDRSLRGLNQNEAAVKILLSGRKIAADAGAKILRDPSKVFNLIPFAPEGDADDYEDPNHLAFEEEPIDQRDEWWRKYGEASGSDYAEGMPPRLQEGRLGDITKQPLLNYLVAVAYEDDETQFSEDASLNTLYDQLLEGVYRRDYDFGPHPGTKAVSGSTEGIQKENFVRILEEIALDAWHGDGRTTTVASIEKRCEKNGLYKYFDDFQDKLRTGISQLLAAFYFRKSGQTPKGEATFEFTHKTFTEYLTALRIVRAVEEIHDERRRNKEKRGAYGLKLKEALTNWIRLCGPSVMDEDLFEFFAGEIRIRHEDSDCAGAWQETFGDFIRHVLQNDLPMHELNKDLGHGTEKRQARNTEEALLAVVHACQRALLANVDTWRREASFHAVNVLEDFPPGTSGDWIRRLQAPRSTFGEALYLKLLSSVVWKSADLSYSNLPSSDFSNANLQKADFLGANLQSANLQETGLRKADLRKADLRKANLRKADLRNIRWAGSPHLEPTFQAVEADGDTRMNGHLRDHIRSKNPHLEEMLEESER